MLRGNLWIIYGSLKETELILSCGFTIPRLGPDFSGLYICCFQVWFCLIVHVRYFCTVQLCLSKLFLPLCVSICNWVESQQTGAISRSHLLWEDLNNKSTVTEYSTLNLKSDTTCKKRSSLKNSSQQRLIQCVSKQTLWF